MCARTCMGPDEVLAHAQVMCACRCMGVMSGDDGRVGMWGVGGGQQCVRSCEGGGMAQSVSWAVSHAILRSGGGGVGAGAGEGGVVFQLQLVSGVAVLHVGKGAEGRAACGWPGIGSGGLNHACG